jgi:uncharacterized protein YqhQ
VGELIAEFVLEFVFEVVIVPLVTALWDITKALAVVTRETFIWLIGLPALAIRAIAVRRTRRGTRNPES